jgi:hypothetical protein
MPGLRFKSALKDTGRVYQSKPRTGKSASRWIQLRGEYAVRASVTCKVNACRDTLERFGAL